MSNAATAPKADLSPSGDADVSPMAMSAESFLALPASMFWEPERIALPPWLGHIPFAFWIVAIQRPKILVELGTHSGTSYSAFCQAIDGLGTETRAYAVDTWEGDIHAGLYDEGVYAELRSYLEPRYGRFSRLIRSTFDDALPQFADGSIDLLHIDGCHTYEAVRHDFENWRPKLSDRAIVLFHDTEERHGDFGVWRFWGEIRRDYPSFSFLHHHGLGVLAVGAQQSEPIRRLLAAESVDPACEHTRQIFARLGAGIQAEFDRRQMVHERDQLASHLNSTSIALAGANAALEAAKTEQMRLQLVVGERTVELATVLQQRDAVTHELARHQRKRRKLTRSLSWKITKPLRGADDLWRALFKRRRGRPTAIAEHAVGDRPTAGLPSLLPLSVQPFASFVQPEPFRERSRRDRPDAAKPRVCCLVHLFYTELWDELAADIRKLGDIPHDVFVNFVETTVTDEAIARVRAEFPAAQIRVSPNRGRDAGGVFSLLASIHVQNYDVALVLHGKRSINLPEGDGSRWRRTLIDPLVGSATIARLNIELMVEDPAIGMIASASCCSTFAGNNAVLVNLLANRLGLTPSDDHPPYVAGAMFMVRPALLSELQRALHNLPFLPYENAAAHGTIDGQLEHAVERMYGALLAARGMRIVWRDTRVTEVSLDVNSARPPMPDTSSPASRPKKQPKLKAEKRQRSAVATLLRGARKFVKRRLSGHRDKAAGAASPSRTYQDWVAAYDTLTDRDRVQIAAHIARFPRRPLISVVMPVYNPSEEQLREAIESVRAQLYPNWELCIADDASTMKHVREVLGSYWHDRRIKIVYRERNGHIAEASNSALAMAEGEFVALMDHDDLIPPHALYELAVVINARPDVDLIYSDEDRVDGEGRRQMGYFKTDWDPDLFLTHNLISHLGAYRRSILQQIGGFRPGFDGSQDYDLALRFIRASSSDRIAHIPAVLYHWRINADTSFSNQSLEKCVQAARRAIREHLQAQGIEAEVGASVAVPSNNRVTYALPPVLPLVSVIIPTRDRVDLLAVCVDGLLNRTDYDRLEILIVDNESSDPATLEYLRRISADERVRVIPFPGAFNYSAMNNHAAEQAKGEVLLLLNNDIEVIEPGWLKEMVSHALRPGVGAVGAKLLYPDGTVQHAGVVLGVGGCAFHYGHRADRASPGYFGLLSAVRTVSAVTGACLAVRRDVYLEVGGLDAVNLKVAFNDVDFCIRVRERGYRNVYAAYAELYHHESVSRGADDTPEKAARFHGEVSYMQSRWKHVLFVDPYYHPSFHFGSGNFELAFPPRRVKPWTVIDPALPSTARSDDRAA